MIYLVLLSSTKAPRGDRWRGHGRGGPGGAGALPGGGSGGDQQQLGLGLVNEITEHLLDKQPMTRNHSSVLFAKTKP